jgi:toxin ParE1/3/4
VSRYRISHATAADSIDILAWSQEQLGEQARRGHESLIGAAIRDIAADPTRTGSAELGQAVRSWHLRGSRNHTTGEVVGRPRHLLIYRVEDDILVIGRILHDAMELRRHIDADVLALNAVAKTTETGVPVNMRG